MTRIKLLFDVEQLAVAGLKGTGIVRVADKVFQELCNHPDFEVYPLLTSERGDFDLYLRVKGLLEIKKRLIILPKLKAMTKGENIWQRIRERVLFFWYQKKYTAVLTKFDAYLSLFSPIAPLVYQSGIKTFMFVHDLIPIYYPVGCDKRFVKKFHHWIKKAKPDLFFVISEYTKKDLIRFKKEKNIPVQVLYLGADSKFNAHKNQTRIEKVKARYSIRTDKYFLAVSELTARKNLPHLLEAFVLFLSKTGAKDTSLVLAGPQRVGYEDIAEKIAGLKHYRDKIVQTGFVDEADLPLLYQGAEAFVYPSLYEGFGLPVLEAMQSGTPVITADNTSLPEVGGASVMYITGTDIEETAIALERIYQDPKFQKHLAYKGICQSKKFNWNVFLARLITSIQQTVKGDNYD